MSIERSRDKKWMGLLCDECNYESTEEFDDFDEMIEDAKSCGWRIFREGGDGYFHHCPSCVNGSRKGETGLQRAKRLLG